MPPLTNKEVGAALARAREAQPAWAALPVSERTRLLERIAELLLRQADDLAGTLVREIAKTRRDSREEIRRSADLVRLTGEEARRVAGTALYGEAFPGFKRDKIAVTQRVPLGTVLAIAPFNYPINLAVSKIAPALAAGNAAVLKPPTQGSLASLRLAELIYEAGCPEGLLGVVTGRGKEIGDFLVAHPEIDMIAFTGSSVTGRRIARLAAMKPLLLELGGKDAAIVLADADLDRTANEIVSGAFAYSGQRCTAVKRVLATNPTMDALIRRLVPAIRQLRVGLPEDDPHVTPLITSQAADYVEALIAEAVAMGAIKLEGGERHRNLIPPTLLDRVTEDMRIAWEEPFGPVLPLIRVKNAEDAIRIANKSEYGLQSSIFSRNIDAALRVASHLEVGTVQINGRTARGPDHFPFLGVKNSGLGVQGIAYSLEAMTRLRTTVLNLNGEAALDDLT